jgi:hypothetical protein
MIEIPPAVDIFLRRLACAQPSPESIWLIASRANGGATNESDWDFVVFADAAYFEMLKASSPPAELAVDVLVVVDASMFRNPWNENKAGDLGRWHWSTQTASHARALNKVAQKSRRL